MAEKYQRGVAKDGEEWSFSADGRRIVLTYSRGVFGLPVAQISFPVEVAKSMTKAIMDVGRYAQRTAPTVGAGRGEP